MSTETPITDPLEIDAHLRDETPPRRTMIPNQDGSVVPFRPDRKHVPEWMRPGELTHTIQWDATLPMIVLVRALASEGLSMVNFKGGFVITRTPEKFSS